MSSSFFVCTRCNTVDLIGFCYPLGMPSQTDKHLCSTCLMGQWHGLFPQKQFDPEKDMVVNAAAIGYQQTEPQLSMD